MVSTGKSPRPKGRPVPVGEGGIPCSHGAGLYNGARMVLHVLRHQWKTHAGARAGPGRTDSDSTVTVTEGNAATHTRINFFTNVTVFTHSLTKHMTKGFSNITAQT